jgi:hypothetical protein
MLRMVGPSQRRRDDSAKSETAPAPRIGPHRLVWGSVVRLVDTLPADRPGLLPIRFPEEFLRTVTVLYVRLVVAPPRAGRPIMDDPPSPSGEFIVVDRLGRSFRIVIPVPDFILLPEPSPPIGVTETRRSTWARLGAEGACRCPICGGVVFQGEN